MKRSVLFHLLALSYCLVLIAQVPSYAQSGSRNGSSTRPRANYGSTTRQQGSATRRSPAQRSNAANAQDSFDRKLWRFLVASKYRNWGPAPGQTGDYYEGQSPHGAFLKMYLNRRALGDATALPSGSVIVKENYGADRQTLMAITVMYRSQGFNPDAGDWYWIKYNPDGTVARQPPDQGGTEIMGKAQGCIACHQDAGGGDFAFFNDR